MRSLDASLYAGAGNEVLRRYVLQYIYIFIIIIFALGGVARLPQQYDQLNMCRTHVWKGLPQP